MKQAEILVVLFFFTLFATPSAGNPVWAADLERVTIATAETDEAYDDYLDYREEAADDIYSHSEYQENTEQQGEQEPATEEIEDEVQEPDFDLDEHEPDL